MFLRAVISRIILLHYRTTYMVRPKSRAFFRRKSLKVRVRVVIERISVFFSNSNEMKYKGNKLEYLLLWYANIEILEFFIFINVQIVSWLGRTYIHVTESHEISRFFFSSSIGNFLVHQYTICALWLSIMPNLINLVDYEVRNI